MQYFLRKIKERTGNNGFDQAVYIFPLSTRSQINPIASSTILANRPPSNASGGNGSIFNASDSSIVLERFLLHLQV